MDFAEAQAVLARAGVRFEAGMADEEFAQVEAEFGFRFPPDLRQFLSLGLPVGGRWVDWRRGDRGQIRKSLAWPLVGICFDIEHNAFWLDEWGEKPPDLDDAFDLARRAVAAAPALIPVLGHRYIPAEPHESGNPVFSVYQTDIIHYGADLLDYLHNEFRYYFGRGAYEITRQPRHIPFWSKLVELNGG